MAGGEGRVNTELSILHFLYVVCWSIYRCLTVSRKGVTLGAQIKQLVDANIYDCDWCSVIAPGTKIYWTKGDNS